MFLARHEEKKTLGVGGCAYNLSTYSTCYQSGLVVPRAQPLRGELTFLLWITGERIGKSEPRNAVKG